MGRRPREGWSFDRALVIAAGEWMVCRDMERRENCSRIWGMAVRCGRCWSIIRKRPRLVAHSSKVRVISVRDACPERTGPSNTEGLFHRLLLHLQAHQHDCCIVHVLAGQEARSRSRPKAREEKGDVSVQPLPPALPVGLGPDVGLQKAIVSSLSLGPTSQTAGPRSIWRQIFCPIATSCSGGQAANMKPHVAAPGCRGWT